MLRSLTVGHCSLKTELWCGVGQPEDSGGDDEDSTSEPDQRRVTAQEESCLPTQKLPSALQSVPHCCDAVDWSCQEAAGVAGQVNHLHESVSTSAEHWTVLCVGGPRHSSFKESLQG